MSKKKDDNTTKGVNVFLELNGKKIISFKGNNFNSKKDVNLALNGLLRLVGGVLISSAFHVMEKEDMEPSIEKLKLIFQKISAKFSDNLIDFMNSSIDKVYGDHLKGYDSDDFDTTGKA
jgi:hypothetical protein